MNRLRFFPCHVFFDASLPRVSYGTQGVISSPLLVAVTRLCNINPRVYQPSVTSKIKVTILLWGAAKFFFRTQERHRRSHHKIFKGATSLGLRGLLSMFNIIFEYLKEDIILIRKEKTNQGSLRFFFINNIYCNICSKSQKGSSRELTLLTFDYFKNTNARQDRTHTHKKAKE